MANLLNWIKLIMLPRPFERCYVMSKRILPLALLLTARLVCAQSSVYFNAPYGRLLPASNEKVGLWWASSGWKISRDKSLPTTKDRAIVIRAARNEAEAAQLVIRPTISLKSFSARAGKLTGPSQATIPAENVHLLRVGYVNVTRPTDKSSIPGHWPDPLPPFKGPINLEPDKNQPLWVRVKVPRHSPAGTYIGTIHLTAQNYTAEITLRVDVYDFILPGRMTCTTAFGLSTGNIFRYQKISDAKQKRQVLEKYWANLSAHHISPYNPAPLDGFKVTWPKNTRSIKPDRLKPVFDFTDSISKSSR